MDILRKEIEVYDDTLKGLRNFKFKIRSTKKEESIKNLKNRLVCVLYIRGLCIWEGLYLGGICIKGIYICCVLSGY